MSRQGIGWFRLDLVTYPENACFLDAVIQDKSYESSVIDYTSRKDILILKEYKEESVLKKETNKQVIIEKKTEVIAK